MDIKKSRELARIFRSKYHFLHNCCPECFSSHYSSTYKSYPLIVSENGVDESYMNKNDVKCSGCGWSGITHDLAPKRISMRIITLHNPWAIWVAKGWKRIDTRIHDRFKNLAGHRIGIHAGIKWDKNAIEIARPYLTENQIDQSNEFLRVGGAIICTAMVLSAFWLRNVDFLGCSVASFSEDALIDCTQTTRFGLYLDDIRVIKAIPCKGRQGIWYHDVSIADYPEELERHIGKEISQSIICN